MKYVSTRDIASNSNSKSKNKTLYTFEEALFNGYAPNDSGLFVPYYLDDLEIKDWKELSKITSYSQLMFIILQKFIPSDEIPPEHLQSICNNALLRQEQSYNNNNDIIDDIPIPVLRVPSSSSSSSSIKSKSNEVFMCELYHGPTYCFKDFGLRVVVGLMEYFATRQKKAKLTLVVATTGDTGPAAVQAVQDLSSYAKSKSSSTEDDSSSNNNQNHNQNEESNQLSIVVHYPSRQISNFQQKQLTIPAISGSSSSNNNIKIVEFDGGGDDMDLPIKNIMKKMSLLKSNNNHNDNNNDNDNDKQKRRYVCGINSYNIGRPLVQMVHFIWIYLRVVEQLGIEPGDKDFVLDIVIPTGAMGNIAGAYMAKKLLGLPLGKLNAGCNINDFTNTMFTTGIISKSTNEIKRTLSEAINIQLPYNLERILFYLTDCNYQQIYDWYKQLEEEGSGNKEGGVDIGSDWLSKLQCEFGVARITDDELCFTQQYVYKHWDNYLADPHTGVAICCAQKLGYINMKSNENDGDLVVLSSGDDNNNNNNNNNSNTNKNNNSISTAAAAVSAVAIIATASPCKFQEAMTIALGKEVWEEYIKSTKFPQSGLDLINTSKKDDDDETGSKNLYYYKSNPSKTLEENQIEWERLSTNIIYNKL